jgi:anti-sigma regulatory factor (Ser/Thr protein kinase)
MPGNFRLYPDGSRLCFTGAFQNQHAPLAIAALHEMMDRRHLRSVELDFSQSIAAFHASVVPLCTDVLRRRAAGAQFSLTLPEDTRFANLFRNTNWAHILDPTNYEPSTYKSRNQVPMSKFTTIEDQETSARRMVDGLLSTLRDFSRTDLSSIEWALSEVTENVIRHSHSPLGGLVALTTQLGKRVDYVVCDAGIGIPESFRSGGTRITSDAAALELSIREGKTSDPKHGQGNGLFGSYEISRVSRSYFHIYSGRAELTLSRSQDLHVKTQAVPFRGTVIAAGIDVSEPDILARALRFKGKPLYQPMDTVEYHYEVKDQQSNDIVLAMVSEAASFRSRQAAAPVFAKLANLLRIAEGQKILIDFEGVPLISSSFADEVFGKLFVEVGAVRFMQGPSFGTSRS